MSIKKNNKRIYNNISYHAKIYILYLISSIQKWYTFCSSILSAMILKYQFYKTSPHLPHLYYHPLTFENV